MSSVDNKQGNLREVVSDYLTNGVYDPNKSQFKAEDYKNRQKTIEERRRVNAKKSTVIFRQFNKLVNGIPTPTEPLLIRPTNEELFKQLTRPTNEERYKRLTRPTQTSKPNGIRKTRHGSSHLYMPKRVSGQDMRKEQMRSQPRSVERSAQGEISLH